jgi:lipopolysaccharide export system protein LptC
MARRTPQAVAEPMAPPAGRTPMDWSSRARTTAQESVRYTRFVGVMKRVLLIAALAVLAMVVVYSLLPRPQNKITLALQTRLGIVNSDLAMLKPHLTGLDNGGNPYVVTADKAVQNPHNTNLAKLSNVDADLTEKKQGTWLSLTAPGGMLNMDTHALKLDGPIAAYADNGYELHTMAANVDLSKGIVRGSRMIVGQGPMGTMRADRFWLNRETHLIFLNGNVHTRIFPNATKKKAKQK